VRFNDGVEGEPDLAEYAGKPRLQPWPDRRVFENMWTPSHGGEIRWGMIPKSLIWASV
jgi:hypothetical protein